MLSNVHLRKTELFIFAEKGVCVRLSLSFLASLKKLKFREKIVFYVGQ